MKIKFASVLATIVILSSATTAALGQYVSGSTGVDVSWPNCNSSIPASAFGIVGVNGGKNFTPNPCLDNQAAHFGNLSLYMNTGYPGKDSGLAYRNSPRSCLDTDLICLAYNYGYNAARYSLEYTVSKTIVSSTWWLDVETINTWTKDTDQNRAMLQGAIDALKESGVNTVGVYSTTAQWSTITNSWKNYLPSWGATTWTNAKNAATYCTGHEFTGGPSYLMQYLPKRSLDHDVAC